MKANREATVRLVEKYIHVGTRTDAIKTYEYFVKSTSDTLRTDRFVEMTRRDELVRVLDGIEDIHFAELTSDDVVRHRLVGQIVDAYGRYDAQQGRHDA